MFLASNCTCAVYFTYTAHVQLLAKNMAATYVLAFAYAFAYAIKQTPYAFVSKIILCMYLLYDQALGRRLRDIETFIRIGRHLYDHSAQLITIQAFVFKLQFLGLHMWDLNSYGIIR